jgi:hypothetical protein
VTSGSPTPTTATSGLEDPQTGADATEGAEGGTDALRAERDALARLMAPRAFEVLGTDSDNRWDRLDRTVAERHADAVLGAGFRRVPEDAEPQGLLAEIVTEWTRQDAKWGLHDHGDLLSQPYSGEALARSRYAGEVTRWKSINQRRERPGPDGACEATWDGLLLEEVYEALAEDDPVKRRAELVQVAVVAAQWISALDRRAVSVSGGGEQP